MGLFFNHKCSVCGVRYPNNQIRSKGARWICVDCAREQGRAKADAKRDKRRR